MKPLLISITRGLIAFTIGIYAGYTAHPLPKTLVIETDVPVCNALPVQHADLRIKASALLK